MSSFYVTLLSNTPTLGNTTDKFTVVLPEKLVFPDVSEWEVALVNLSYPNSFNTLANLGEEKIELIFDDKKIPIFLLSNASKNPLEVQENFEEACKKVGLGKEVIILKFDLYTNRFELTFSSQIPAIEITEQLKYSLGFEKNYIFTPGRNIATYAPDLWGGDHSFFVYCNIIANQIIGNVKAQVLRICNFRGFFGELVEETFINPQYCNLVQEEIDEILIEIRNSNSLPIKFNWGTVRLTLCFRKKSFF